MERLWKILHRNKTGEVCWLLVGVMEERFLEGKTKKGTGKHLCGVIKAGKVDMDR